MVPDKAFFLPTLHSGNRREIGREVWAIPTLRVGIPEAGTYYANLAGICKPGIVNFGIAVQSSVGLQVSLTLDCADLVQRNPSEALWHPDITINVNDVTPLVNANGSPLFGSVLRIKAQGPGVMLVASC